MVSRIEVGVLGKHPGYGDFVRHGIADETADELTRWIDTTLTEVRDQLKADWADFWDNGQELRFWLGRQVLGQTCIGIFRPSRDRVGRRYPLILMAQGVAVPPPVIDRDQRPWDVLSSQMKRMQPGQGAAALLRGIDSDALFVAPEPDSAASEGPVLWAHHPEGDLDALLASAAPVDHGRAATQRSYWWSTAAPGRAPVWLAHPGLPQGQALAWAIGGEHMDAPVPQPVQHHHPEAPQQQAPPPPQDDAPAYHHYHSGVAAEVPHAAPPGSPDGTPDDSDPYAAISADSAPEPMPQDAFHSASVASLPEVPVPDRDSLSAEEQAHGYGEVTDYGLDLPAPLESPVPRRTVGDDDDADDWADFSDSDLPSLAMPREGDKSKT